MPDPTEMIEETSGALEAFLDLSKGMEKPERQGQAATAMPSGEEPTVNFGVLYAWAMGMGTPEQAMMADLAFTREADAQEWDEETQSYKYKHGPATREWLISLAQTARKNAQKAYSAGVAGAAGVAAGPSPALAERQREFDLTLQFQREKERQRIKEALANLELQGVGQERLAGTAAMDLAGRLATSAIPPGLEFLPGWEPGGAMARAAELGGYTFTPLPAQGTLIPTGIVPEQTSRGVQAAILRLIGGG